MPPLDAARVSQRLLDYELSAARKAGLMPGAIDTVRQIREAGLKIALLTRNARPAMQMILEKFSAEDLAFDLTMSREDGPIKPEPDGVLRACRQLDITPQGTCCVGDFHYDITAANAAGATSVLLVRSGKSEFADEADYVIHQLSELIKILGL